MFQIFCSVGHEDKKIKRRLKIFSKDLLVLSILK